MSSVEHGADTITRLDRVIGSYGRVFDYTLRHEYDNSPVRLMEDIRSIRSNNPAMAAAVRYARDVTDFSIQNPEKNLPVYTVDSFKDGAAIGLGAALRFVAYPDGTPIIPMAEIAEACASFSANDTDMIEQNQREYIKAAMPLANQIETVHEASYKSPLAWKAMMIGCGYILVPAKEKRIELSNELRARAGEVRSEQFA